MPARVIGGNLTGHRGPGIQNFIMKMLKGHGGHGFPSAVECNFFTKAGAPATNTEADNPGKGGVFIWDTTNSDLYFVHTWVSATSFTVVKVVD